MKFHPVNLRALAESGRWSNYHTHCHFCDGKGSPREVIEEALKIGMAGVGFSSHAPVPFPTTYTMKIERLQEYRAEIAALRSEYAGRIEVACGLEIDYVRGIVSPADKVFRDLDLDYCIGSVHVGGTFESGEHWMVDSGKARFAAGIEQIYEGNARAAVEEYYRRVIRMVEEARPDIIGHIDLVKRTNGGKAFFDDEASWYVEATEAVLEVVAKAGSIIEVNTGGLARARCDELYPSDRMLKRILELGIPVTLSSDAHQASFLTALFPESAGRLVEMGFREIFTL